MLNLLIWIFAFITVSGLVEGNTGMFLYGLGAMIVNVGVLLMK